MYEIIMSNGDRAECDSVAACLVTAATLRDDSGDRSGTSRVVEVAYGGEVDEPFIGLLNRHLVETRER